MQSSAFVRHATGLAAALAGVLWIAVPAGAQVAVTINGNGTSFSPPPIIEGGRVFVPLRGVFEQLGATVVYSNGTINATGNGRDISLQIGSTQATIDGQPETIDVAPFIVGASTFVPLRFISEALGASVNWDNSNHVVSIDTPGATTAYATSVPSYATQSDNEVSYAPPPIPIYEQPYVPEPNFVWQPGYWAWSPYGYYWVPGTWVEAPQPGYLWTPGYWAFNNRGFFWNQGFWALVVGFYGGVNYGGGYYGHGYDGGRWEGNTFRYNTYVSRVDITMVNNVYEDRTVYVDNSPHRIGYNGGPNGVRVRPSEQELTVLRGPRLALTPAQQEHILTAAQDRRLLATVNHAAPPVLSVAHPLSASNRPEGLVPITESDRLQLQKPIVPASHAPAVQTAVPYHPPVVRTAPPPRPESLPTPLPYRGTGVVQPLPYRGPALQTAPPDHPLLVRTPPPSHPPAMHLPPPYHPFKPAKPARPMHAVPTPKPAP